MSLRFHEISESRHRILNPFTEEKLRLLGEVSGVGRGDCILDLCCGKAEMLCTWARDHGITGAGVDVSTVFLAAAAERAEELGVASSVQLVEADATAFAATSDELFDVVSCIGATWIGGGLVGTLRLMAPRLRPGGTMLVGEPYWTEPVPDDVAILDGATDEFATLAGTLDRIEDAGFSLIEMVLADGDSWDRYVAAQWSTVDRWLRDNPDADDAAELRAWMRAGQRDYLSASRRYLGWGVFVLRASSGD